MLQGRRVSFALVVAAKKMRKCSSRRGRIRVIGYL